MPDADLLFVECLAAGVAVLGIVAACSLVLDHLFAIFDRVATWRRVRAFPRVRAIDTMESTWRRLR